MATDTNGTSTVICPVKAEKGTPPLFQNGKLVLQSRSKFTIHNRLGLTASVEYHVCLRGDTSELPIESRPGRVHHRRILCLRRISSINMAGQ